MQAALACLVEYAHEQWYLHHACSREGVVGRDCHGCAGTQVTDVDPDVASKTLCECFDLRAERDVLAFRLRGAMACRGGGIARAGGKADGDNRADHRPRLG